MNLDDIEYLLDKYRTAYEVFGGCPFHDCNTGEFFHQFCYFLFPEVRGHSYLHDSPDIHTCPCGLLGKENVLEIVREFFPVKTWKEIKHDS